MTGGQRRFDRRKLFVILIVLLISACDLHFGTLPPTATVAPTPPPAPSLIVVWAAGGNLFAWRERDQSLHQIASSAVIRPVLAPDGQHVAFTSGSQGDAISLWVVGIDGTGETQVVAPDVLRSIRNGHPQIYQVQWLDKQTIYFNTYQRYDSGYTIDDDLYRVQIGSPPQLILPPGAGGDFAISPNGQQIALVTAGNYGLTQGHVALTDPLGKAVRQAFHFDAVTTPDNAPFYPPLQWDSEGDAVYAPIPDHELTYGGLEPAIVTLWRATDDGAGRIWGMAYSAISLPVWSEDASSLLYVRRDEANEQRQLIVADGDGQNAEVYASAPLTPTSWWGQFQWIPKGNRFIYESETYGQWLIGQRGASPKPFDFDWMKNTRFADENTLVYDGASDADVLYAAHIDDDQSIPLGTFSTPPLFDALVAR